MEPKDYHRQYYIKDQLFSGIAYIAGMRLPFFKLKNNLFKPQTREHSISY